MIDDIIGAVGGEIASGTASGVCGASRWGLGFLLEYPALSVASRTSRAGGKSVVENLARDLQLEFPGRNGFSAQNMWLMRQLYLEYHDKPNLQPLVREISWAKNLVIFSRCKDDLTREFYLRAVARFGWTKNVLQHQIDNQSYEKYLLGQTNFDLTLPESAKTQAGLAIKDHYTFDFLELAEEHCAGGSIGLPNLLDSLKGQGRRRGVVKVMSILATR